MLNVATLKSTQSNSRCTRRKALAQETINLLKAMRITQK
jgi:hypothetical protein